MHEELFFLFQFTPYLILMQHCDVERLLFATLVFTLDVFVCIHEWYVSCIDDSVCICFRILVQTNDTRALLWVLSLLRLKLLTHLSLLSANHLDVLETDPELCRRLRWRRLLCLNLSWRVIWTIIGVRLGCILLTTLDLGVSRLIHFALLEDRDWRISNSRKPLDRVWDNIALILSYATLVIAFLISCRLHRDFLYYLQALDRGAASLLTFDECWHVTSLDSRDWCGRLLFIRLCDTFCCFRIWVFIYEHLGLHRTWFLAWRIIAKLTLTVFVWT